MNKEQIIKKIEDLVIDDMRDLEHRNEQTLYRIPGGCTIEAIASVNNVSNDLTERAKKENLPRPIVELKYRFRGQTVEIKFKEIVNGYETRGRRAIEIK